MYQPFGHAILEPIGGLLGGHRAAEIVALPLSAPVALEEIELRAGLL